MEVREADTPSVLIARILATAARRSNLLSITDSNTQPRGPYEHQQADAKLRCP